MTAEANSTVGEIRLRDGRALAFAEYGDARGCPLVFFHGTPGSRLTASLLDEPARRRSVRVIAPERPGFGRSDLKPGRTLLDWSDDVIELATSLGLERFAVAGISGGGPYVAVCAYRIPERLTRAAILSGIGPVDLPGATDGMLFFNRLSLVLARNLPPLLRAVSAATLRSFRRDPERAFRRMVAGLPAPDRELLADPDFRGTFVADFQAATERSTRGMADEFALFSRPWGFRLEDVRTRVHLWHGELDRNCPVAMGRAVARALPDCVATFVPDAGHLFMARRGDELLKALEL
jgi:pimeloyl-ACP methyl ester carboxylesterase